MFVIPSRGGKSLDPGDVPAPPKMRESFLKDRRTLWLIAGLVALLFTTANLPWQLDDYDQAKQAYTSFEMVNEGHWLYQNTPHERVATKPPLVGWVSAALFKVTRSWDIAWRLPSIVSALALATVLVRAAKCAYGATAGLIALAAFGFNLLSPRLASLVRTDMPLALVVFLIGFLLWRKIRAGTEWTRREQIYVFLLLTAAMLIKGPIVYAFLLPGIVIDAVAVSRRETRTPRTASRQQSAWPGWWPWVASLAIFLIWVIGGIQLQPGFYQEVVLREFLGRFGETIHRPQPLFFYFPHLLHKFAPWSVLIVAIAITDTAAAGKRDGFNLSNLRSRGWWQISDETLWLLCWSVSGLIVMSLIPSKRVDRIFPVIPPFCLLLAAQVGKIGAQRRSDRPPRHLHVLLTTTLVVAILFTLGYTGWKIFTGYRDHRDALAVFGRNVRHEAEAHHWRYEVISAKDEGLLLYFRKAHFIVPQRAVTEWNDGTIDALVTSREKAAMLTPQLQGAVYTDSQEPLSSDYVLITR